MEKIRKVCGMLSIKNFLLLTVAGIVNAFGVVIFLAPVKLYDSGISGTAMLVSQLTPKWIIFPLPVPFVSILDIFLDGIIHTGCIIIIPVVPVLIIIAIHIDIIVAAIVRIMRMTAVILAVRTAWLVTARR